MRINALLLAIGLIFARQTFADDAESLFASAEAKYRLGNYKEALADYQSFQQQFPKDWRAEQAQYTAAFILHKKMKDSSKAVAAFKGMSDTKTGTPISRMAKFHMADAYVKSGEIQKAIATYDELKTGPENARTREINRAIRLLRKTPHEDVADPTAWGEKLKGKKWRKLKKLNSEKKTN